MIRFVLNKCAVKTRVAKISVRIHDTSIDIAKLTGLTVRPECWNEKTGFLKKTVVMKPSDRTFLLTHLQGLMEHIEDRYHTASGHQTLTSQWLEKVINDYWNKPASSPLVASDLDSLFDEFICCQDISPTRAKQYMVTKRILQRYEMALRKYVRGKSEYRIVLSRMTAEDLGHLKEFIIKEHLFAKEHPEMYVEITDKRTAPAPRGHNTVIDILKKLRAFFNWCEKKRYIERSPFRDFPIGTEIYGTPYYLTKNEIEQLWRYEFHNEYLEQQRDVFIFQCCIGCRIGDLYRLRDGNIIDGCIQYIPAKTLKTNISTVSVPLNAKARTILARYKNLPDGNILPLVLQQEYNEAIKAALTEVGITRHVTVVDPVSMKQVVMPINQIASSHMARRTFVGNLYKEVKDPAIIASMSGHKEDSKAFSRYRAIDNEIKKQLVDLL